MAAGSNRLSPQRCRHAWLAVLCVLSASAFARADQSLEAQLAETSELAHYVPEKALKTLLKLDELARSAATDTRAEYLAQLSEARRNTGDQKAAIALAEESIALGKEKSSPVALAKGMLAKGEVMLVRNELDESHQLCGADAVALAGDGRPPGSGVPRCKHRLGDRTGGRASHAFSGHRPARDGWI